MPYRCRYILRPSNCNNRQGLNYYTDTLVYPLPFEAAHLPFWWRQYIWPYLVMSILRLHMAGYIFGHEFMVMANCAEIYTHRDIPLLNNNTLSSIFSIVSYFRTNYPYLVCMNETNSPNKCYFAINFVYYHDISQTTNQTWSNSIK